MGIYGTHPLLKVPAYDWFQVQMSRAGVATTPPPIGILDELIGKVGALRGGLNPGLALGIAQIVQSEAPRVLNSPLAILGLAYGMGNVGGEGRFEVLRGTS